MAFIEERKLTEILHRLKHINLENMRSVKLMSRIDTKYVTHASLLLPILESAARERYNVFFETTAINHYITNYFDTESLAMYIMHHNRRLHRQKIRCRTYVDSGLSFLEIKDKNNKGRTSKIRMPVTQNDSNSLKKNIKAVEFINSNSQFDFNTLVPILMTEFYRITLVNEQKTERVTIDTGLTFRNYSNEACAVLEDFIIIELKQDSRYVSEMRTILRELHIKPFRLSKYCIGVALTNPKVKANRFKYKIHLMNKLKKIYE